MRFNPKADISGGRVKDVRGGGGGGGGMGNLPIGGITGGGIGTTIVVVVIYLIVQFAGGGSGGGGPATETDRYDQCKTGADANNSADCARKAVEVSLESYWSQVLPQQTNTAFRPTQVVTFDGSTNTGCGAASKDVGPFYCPTDQTIYLDTTFFADVLEGQLGGQGGDFVEPYVIGHEFGHHIQNLLGTMGRVRTQTGPTSDSVRLELQADCYAGMWAKGATGTTDGSGVKIFESIDDGDIQEALDAAKTVGDDRIQQAGGGDVNKEQWTHGSSAERMKWFKTGYSATNIKQCDTFSAASL
ncbi:peptidase [Nocardioides anomalus]|uniref:Peptidase n=1 Tax=Nocardioides anomalus TaxID=2712223 RepID=A0A6G6WD02_9ACTN|nr:neutral zinc metallopeptidase [Nocardioides anomalus]QIG43122.1 peptidase [Nocardioides anomalus]